MIPEFPVSKLKKYGLENIPRSFRPRCRNVLLGRSASLMRLRHWGFKEPSRPQIRSLKRGSFSANEHKDQPKVADLLPVG
jgi:hypothetical protein